MPVDGAVKTSIYKKKITRCTRFFAIVWLEFFLCFMPLSFAKHHDTGHCTGLEAAVSVYFNAIIISSPAALKQRVFITTVYFIITVNHKVLSESNQHHGAHI